MRPDIVPGARFPDYELTDHARTRQRLSGLQGEDPMILVLSRGAFCPKDHQQHRELVELHPRIAVAYTRIVTISTDNILKTIEFRDALGAQWTFLADPGRKVQKDLGIQDYTDPWNDPMIPYTLVLAPGLVVHSIYNGHWFWGRPSPEELRRDLRAVTRDVRPDWDPTAPGLREAWAAGDRSQHWPYSEGGPTDVYPELAPPPAVPSTRDRLEPQDAGDGQRSECTGQQAGTEGDRAGPPGAPCGRRGEAEHQREQGDLNVDQADGGAQNDAGLDVAEAHTGGRDEMGTSNGQPITSAPTPALRATSTEPAASNATTTGLDHLEEVRERKARIGNPRLMPLSDGSTAGGPGDISDADVRNMLARLA